MPRNNQGVYTLPSGNPVQTGTQIQSTWANTLASDLANEITNSLDRNGRGGMLGPFKFADGAQGVPSQTFNNEPTLGFWRPVASTLALQSSGGELARFTLAQLTLSGAINHANTLLFRTAGTDRASVNVEGLTSEFGLRTFGAMSAEYTRPNVTMSVDGGSTPILRFSPGTSAANRMWDLYATATEWNMRITDNVGNNPVSWLRGVRSGATVTEIQLAATRLSINGKSVATDDLAVVDSTALGSEIATAAKGKMVLLSSSSNVDAVSIGLGGRVIVVNFSGQAWNLTEPPGYTLYWGGMAGAHGTRSLASGGVCTIIGLGDTRAVVFGDGLS